MTVRQHTLFIEWMEVDNITIYCIDIGIRNSYLTRDFPEYRQYT